jgi:3-deoxy-D-manno-octulosonic-acid transferase
VSDRPLSLRVYGAASGAVAALAPWWLARRVRGGKEDPARLGERLGRASVTRPAGALVWVHAVSVGEAVSALSLIEWLRRERPGLAVLVTTGTLTSAKVLAERLPARAIHQFAPLDTPGAVRRFLDHWRPAVGLFVESELWPNLILRAREAGVRLALVSARITARSAANWGRAPGAARAVLGAFEVVLAQDEATAVRIQGLGGRDDGRLNLKDAAEPLAADGGALVALRAATKGRPVVLAASTHPGEELLIAQAVDALPATQPLLVIAPRHPARAQAIAQALAPRRVARRSQGETIGTDTGVYLADTLGELGLFYRLADVCVIGGSLAAGIGGHNPLEPARLGAAIVTGPGVANFQAVYEAMAAAGAAVRVEDGYGLGAVLGRLLADEPARAELGARALAFAAARREGLEAGWARLRPLLPTGPSS